MRQVKFKNDHDHNDFTIAYVHGHETEFVEVHVIDMDGWLLYECFILPSYKTYYFGWDENAENLEWIDLEKEQATDEIKILCSELVKYKQRAA